ncbi:hypothetical protein K1X84_15060 [bacterium]|nr:hypothetical protein [bacterium]
MGNTNESTGGPPPGGGGVYTDSGDLSGMLLEIAADSTVEISHTYPKTGSPDMNCLIVVQVQIKGQMKLKWADPNYGKESGDHRASALNAKLASDKILILMCTEVGFENTTGAITPEDFWISFGMTKQTRSDFDPYNEYWGVSNKRNDMHRIHLKAGLIKQVDLSWPGDPIGMVSRSATKSRTATRSAKKTAKKKVSGKRRAKRNKKKKTTKRR